MWQGLKLTLVSLEVALVFSNSHLGSLKKLLNVCIFSVCAMCFSNELNRLVSLNRAGQAFELKRLLSSLGRSSLAALFLHLLPWGVGLAGLFLVFRACSLNPEPLIKSNFSSWLAFRSLGPLVSALPWDSLPGPKASKDQRTVENTETGKQYWERNWSETYLFHAVARSHSWALWTWSSSVTL